jgi:hypothetical protein
MGGGLIELITKGIQDAPLTFNPEFTFFKAVYKQYTNFAIQQYVKNLGIKKFDTLNNYKIENTGDLLQSLNLTMKIPKFTINKKIINNINNGEYYDINNLVIYYNNIINYIYNFNNNYYIIPEYLFKLFDYKSTEKYLNNLNVLTNLLPNLITIKDLPNSFKFMDILEDSINPIISLLKKYSDFFESYWFNIILNNDNFQYNNKLITQHSFINYLNNKITNILFTNYNYFNNNRKNKQYYNLNEVEPYLNYQNIDALYIKQNNNDVDIIYNYCLQNNKLNYKLYQTNCLFYNSTFIYNLLLQIYPESFNTFTFWKKYSLLNNNIPNLNYTISTNNSFSEWITNLNLSFNSVLTNIELQIFEIYKKTYAITENTISQLFNLLVINKPDTLFIILSTFINHYDNTSFTSINFDDYNSILNTNLLNIQINNQLNNYFSLEKNNPIIISNAILKKSTIYPVDLMILYPYTAYKLTEKIITSLYFENYMFIIFWRNKINNFYFMNYHQFNSINLQNGNLYDTNELSRNLTFYINLDMKKILFLKQIKKYFIDIFYSSSFCGCININETNYENLKLNINQIASQSLNNNNVPIALNENLIKPHSNLMIKTNYEIINFTQPNTKNVIINNWNNNWNINSKYYIYYNNIKYSVHNFTNDNFTNDNFTNENFILSLNFNENDIPIISNSFILEEYYYIDVPLVSFNNLLNNPTNKVYSFNIFKAINNKIVTDNIISNNIFNISNMNVILSSEINQYFTYFKIIKFVTIDNVCHRFIIDIKNNNTNYSIITDELFEFNKNNLISVEIEFLYISYTDLGRIDVNIIVNNQFEFKERIDWQYNKNNTYWLFNNKDYILLKYENNNFIILDDLKPNTTYTIREIYNDNIPNLFNYINYYNNPSSPSDLMDFFFQTTFIMIMNTDLNNMYPYIYIYNLPFLLSLNSEIYLDNNKINNLLPLNTNQFFNKQVSPIFSKDCLINKLNHIDLLKIMTTLINTEYSNPDYKNIFDILEQSKTELLNLNLNMLNNTTIYGNSTLQIIKNSMIINNNNLTTFNNDDYNKYNNLVLDIYGNNPNLISNIVIQNIKKPIYNTPQVSLLPSRKISSNLIEYLSEIPKYYQEQIDYVSNNTDYLLITNEEQYIENYKFINDFKFNIYNIFFTTNNYLYKTLFNIKSDNLDSIYYNNIKFEISSLNKNGFIANFITNLSNYDNIYDHEIIQMDNEVINNEKFNYFGPIYLDTYNNINFNNNISFSGYNYIQLDNLKFYPIDNNLWKQTINKVNTNSYLYNITSTTDNNDFTYCNNLHYYLVKLNLDITQDDRDVLYCNNKTYYYEKSSNDDNTIIKIISKNILDIKIIDYFIGNTTGVQSNSVNNFTNINFNEIKNFTKISISKVEILEYYKFNYYSTSSSNNYIINNVFQPITRIFNSKTFIFIDNTNNEIKLNIKNYSTIPPKKLPPFKLDINLNFVFFTKQTDFEKYKDTSLLKLDNYIITLNDLKNKILDSNNYDLYILPKTNVNLIDFDISGSIVKENNKIKITLNNILNLISFSYYLINDRYIFIEDISNNIIISNNLKYYNLDGSNNSVTFYKIYLLDNSYFENKLPLVSRYLNVNMKDDFLENKIFGTLDTFKDDIKDNYIINSILYNDSLDIKDYNTNNEFINILGNDEMLIEIGLSQQSTLNFIRPIILKNKMDNVNVPKFTLKNNNNNINNSFIILNSIPNINENFLTIDITDNSVITSIVTLNPCINIYSTNNNKIHSISFNSVNNLVMNKYYLWKIIFNDIYPVYFWTYFTTNFINYTLYQICEPIYVSQSSKQLFTIINPDIIFLGSIPNILYLDTSSNNFITISNILYTNRPRYISSKYYITNIYNNNNLLKILEYNFSPCKKNYPKLKILLYSDIISFDSNYIYISNEKINLIKQCDFLIIINNNKYYYINNIIIISNAIFINDTLDINSNIIVYYSFYNITFNKNKLILYHDDDNNYKIVNYQYNDLQMNELILINEDIFLVQGLNTLTNYYDLILLNNENVIIYNNNIIGYFSLGLIDNFSSVELPKNTIEPVIYNFDNSTLLIGDFFILNKDLYIKMNKIIKNDIFAFNKMGNNIKILVNNFKYYNFEICNTLQILDIIIFQDVIYKVKFIKDHQIFFYNKLNLANGLYNFYIPYQPLIIKYISIDENNKITNFKLNDYSFIEIENTYFKIINNIILNLPSTYKNLKLLTRVLEINNSKLYFGNDLLISNNDDSTLKSNMCIKIKSIVFSRNTIDLNTNIILDKYLYYLQPVKINSIINFINDVRYRDTTTYIDLLYPIDLVGNVYITFTPLSIYQNEYYSLFQTINFKIPDIYSSNYTGYNVIDGNLINVFDSSNNKLINFKYNYLPTNNNDYLINSHHLLIEITEQDEIFTHLIKIVYPRKIRFYTNVINVNSKFYLDKIYPIIINWDFGYFYFDSFIFYKQKEIIKRNTNEIILWYSFNIKTIGTPIFENNKFKIEINNGSLFINQKIYIDQNSENTYDITYENGKYYLISENYLGNNIDKIYIKKNNYITNFELNNKEWNTINYNNHNDTNLLTLIEQNETTYYERIVIPVIVELILVNDFYKYKITSINNNIIIINKEYKWYIDDPYLEISDTYVVDNISYIFTKNKIAKSSTQLFMYKSEKIENFFFGQEIKKFNKLRISKTLPEIVENIQNNTNITPYMIINSIKSWSSWSLLSFYNNNILNDLLSKGEIAIDDLNNVNLINIDQEIYWTQDEYKYLASFLLFIKSDIKEYNKILIQNDIFSNIKNQIIYWLNDYSFWKNPKERINLFLSDFNYNNVSFNGYCLVFSDEKDNFNKYFINKNNIITRKYVLSNQYIIKNINKLVLSRDMTQINNEINNLINKTNETSYYGIEINELLYKFVTIGEEYNKISTNLFLTSEIKYDFLNSIKLFINYIWNNHKKDLSIINQKFNNKLEIINNITHKNILKNNYYYFNDNFDFIKSNTLPSTEIYIYNINTFEENFYDNNKNNYIIDSLPIYPYYISLGITDLILPDKIYKINFHNLKIENLFDQVTYNSQLDFYLKNNIDPTIDFTLVGLSNYDVVNEYLGNLYKVKISSVINFDIIKIVNYKNKNVILYNYYNNILEIISTQLIEINTILELRYNIGIKQQSNRELIFYQNNFNYVENKTYIKIETVYLSLHYNSSNQYSIEKDIILPQNIVIVNILNISEIINTNLNIYKLLLSKPFKYYNEYINNSLNIIPTNFVFNDNIIPYQIKIYDENMFYCSFTNMYNITSMQHYINIGESPPLQINSITKNKKYYLYNTNEYINLLPHSEIYLYDSSNNELCTKSNLNTEKFSFIINTKYTNEQLKSKLIKIENKWNITTFTYDQSNNNLSFAFPTDLDFKTTENYKYYINNIEVFSLIQIEKKNNLLKINLGIVFTEIVFKQIYFSNKLQINSIEKIGGYLYNTNEYINLLPHSEIYLYEGLNDELCTKSNLNTAKFSFIIDTNYSNEQLKSKLIRIENIWNITTFLYNPNNDNLSFAFPKDLDFKTTIKYEYYINNIKVLSSTIQIGKQNISLIVNLDNNNTNIVFKQIYFSNTIIYKPTLNQYATINLLTNNQYINTPYLYLNGYDKIGNNIGKYLYKIILVDTSNNIIFIDQTLILIDTDEIAINLFYTINNYTIVVGCDEFLITNKIYKLIADKIIYNIDRISYYQEVNQNLLFYSQTDLSNINVFVNSELNEYSFINQLLDSRYYISSKNQNIILENIYNNNKIVQAETMKIKNNIINNTQTIIEQPIFKSPSKWLKYINLVLGEQILETINEDTININYNLYYTAEKKYQYDKITKIIETKTHWQVFLPLDFWFNNNSTLAIPLICIPYIDLMLSYNINKIENIIDNELINYTFSNRPEIKIELCIDTILLDTEERRLFGSTQHEYVIERFKIYSSQLVYKMNQDITINFTNLIKDIIFISQPIYHPDDTSYKIENADQDYYLSYWNKIKLLYNVFKINRIFTSEIPITYANDFAILDNIEKELLINKSDRILKIKKNKYLQLFKLDYILYFMDKYLNNKTLIKQIQRISLYFAKNYKNHINIIEKSPITSLCLKSNDNNFFTGLNNIYFNNLIPYDKFKNSVPTGYYVYTFSLNPLDKQPNGHLNFSNLDNVILTLTNNQNINEEPFNLKIIVKEYQILRLMSGLGALAWHN